MRLFYLRLFAVFGFALSVFGIMALFRFMSANFSLLLAEFRSCGSDQPLPKPQEGCPRAGPQRFLVWVRVWWCCAFHKQNAKYPLPTLLAAQSIAVGDFVTVLFKLSASFSFPYLTKVKLSKRKICASQRLSQISFIAVLSSPSITTLANAGMHIRSMPIGAR